MKNLSEPGHMLHTLALAKTALHNYKSLVSAVEGDQTAADELINQCWRRYERYAEKLGFSPNYLGYLIHHEMI